MHACGIAEMNRICLVLFDVNIRIFGPYLSAIHRILISVMGGEPHTSSSTASDQGLSKSCGSVFSFFVVGGGGVPNVEVH
jgi:hypothetical protein